jgi:hypothetical protein
MSKPWTHASASQIERFRRCNRKWWWKYVAGISEPTDPAAALGKTVHDVAEHWLRDESLDDLDQRAVRIFLPGRPFLPEPPIDPDDVEQWIGLPDICEPFGDNPDGQALDTPVIPLVGRVDLIEKRDGLTCITDHKTTSNKYYARSEEQLKTNIQAVVYGKAVFEALPSELVVRFRHVYYLTRGPARSWEVGVNLHRAHVDKHFGGIVETLREMRDVQRETEAAKAPHNPTACDDYGGCPFRGRCRLIGGKGPMGILSKTKKKVDNDSAPKPDKKAGEGMTLQERMAAKEAAKNGGAKPLPDPSAAAERLKATSTADRDPVAPNPPDGTRRDVVGDVGEAARKNLSFELNGETIKVSKAKKIELCEFLKIPEEQRSKARVKRLKKMATAQLLGETSDPETDGEAPAAMQQKADAEQAADTKPPEPAPVAAETTVDKPASNRRAPGALYAEALQGHAVFVDSIPLEWPGKVRTLNDVIAPMVADIEKRDGVPYYACDKFREKAKELAGFLADMHRGGGLVAAGDAVVIATNHPLAAEMADILARGAAFVVRGF